MREENCDFTKEASVIFDCSLSLYLDTPKKFGPVVQEGFEGYWFSIWVLRVIGYVIYIHTEYVSLWLSTRGIALSNPYQCVLFIHSFENDIINIYCQQPCSHKKQWRTKINLVWFNGVYSNTLSVLGSIQFEISDNWGFSNLDQFF